MTTTCVPRPADAGARAWAAQARGLADFIAVHSRFPRLDAADPGEQGVARWLAARRAEAAGFGQPADLSLAREQALDRLVPGWRGRDPEAAWLHVARQAAAMTRARGVPPDPGSADPAVRRLGVWLAVQARWPFDPDAARITTEARRAWLTEHIPGWMTTTCHSGRSTRSAAAAEDRPVALTAAERRWKGKAAELAAFIASTGHFPGPSRTPAEHLLYRWLADQRRKIADGRPSRLVSAGRASYLDQVAPGWREARTTMRQARSFKERAEDLALHRGRHGRWPAMSSRNEQEVSLARWLRHQRALADGRVPGRQIAAERIALLDRLAPGWRDAQPEASEAA